MTGSVWAVTEIAHPALRGVSEDCEKCLSLTQSAVTHARVTGSVGATYEVVDTTDGETHSVTVTRAIRLHAEQDEDHA